MTFDLLHRIRWANVARAAAVALALLLALAWPRLRAHSDALPPAIEAAPAVAAKAPRVERPARVVEAKTPHGQTAAVPKRRVAQRRGVRRARHARHRRPRPPRIAIPAATPAPAYVALPAAAAVPAAEFRP